jgi:4-hydroxy-2-oxoheptanedioate aldolase
MTGSIVAMNGSAKKCGIAKTKKFDFKPVNHKEFAEKGMALYRAPSLLQPHRVRLSMSLQMSNLIWQKFWIKLN